MRTKVQVRSLLVGGLVVAALGGTVAFRHEPGTARRPLSGDLAKRVSLYSGTEFGSLVRSLKFGPAVERTRRCMGSAACTNGSAHTAARIDAVIDADSLSAGNLPPNGVVAARIVITGEWQEGVYRMKPGSNYSYYLIVLPGNERANWKLEEFNAANGTHTTIGDGVMNGCNHPFRRGARADFKTCSMATTVGFGTLSQGGEPPIWIGCDVGCCTADPGCGQSCRASESTEHAGSK